MKKLIFILVSLGVIGGSVYALFPGLFPDTATFPRVPTGPGTVGSIISDILGETDLANYSGDGTVPNSLALSGVTQTGYLRDDPSCPGGQKFVGIKSNGRRDCAMTTTLLADYGKIDTQGCAATYYRADGSTNGTNTGDILKAGDIVKTAPGCPMNIVFSDYSVLRLDGDTTVSLDLGSYADGTSIASAIISNGSLWGRILTETGSYSIGTDTVVAGVRGTSVYVRDDSPSPTITKTGGLWDISEPPHAGLEQFRVVHSATPSSAATGTCIDADGVMMFPMKSLSNLNVSSTMILAGGCSSLLVGAATMPISTFTSTYDMDPTISRYTIADLDYMARLLSSATLTTSQKNRINTEISFTKPANTDEKDAICPEDGGGLEPMTFWESVLGTKYDLCQQSGLKAFANYSGSTASGTLFAPSARIPFTPGGGFSGASMPRFAYDDASLQPLLSGDWSLELEFTSSGLSLSPTQYLFQMFDSSNTQVYSLSRPPFKPGIFQVYVVGSTSLDYSASSLTGIPRVKIVKTGLTYKTLINGSEKHSGTISSPIKKINIGGLSGQYWAGTIRKMEIK